MKFWEKHKKIIIVSAIVVAPFVLFGAAKAYIEYKRANIDDRSYEVLSLVETASPIREDYNRSCFESYQGFGGPTGYDCQYSSERYYEGAPDIKTIQSKLEQKGLRIVRIRQGSGDNKHVYLRAESKDGRFSLEVDYVPDLASRPDVEIAQYPPSLRDEHIYQIIVRDITKVF